MKLRYPRTSTKFLTQHKNIEKRLKIVDSYDEKTTEHVIYPPPQTAAGGNKTKGLNTIMSTLFALEFWSNKIIHVDIILSITLTVS